MINNPYDENGKNRRDNYYDDDFGDNGYIGEPENNDYTMRTDVNYHPQRDIRSNYGKAVSSREPKPVKKKHKILKKVLCILLVLTIVFMLVSWLLSFMIPQKTTVLIMATDEDGTRTDTLMVAVFDKKDKSLNFISVPRDTYVTVSDEMYDKMREEYPEPGSKSMKINAVHHFGGEKYGVKFINEVVEQTLNIKLDFYVKVNFDAFKYIIDSIGGIDFYVPQDMKYDDPIQDLHINLKEGNQHLNGEQAEQVVRYRSGYANADLGRISVQQEFMKAFVSQTLSKGNIITHPFTYLNTLFKYKYVVTNANIFDVMPYIFVINGIKTDGITTYTLPGAAGNKGGQSVYILNESETKNLISEIMG